MTNKELFVEYLKVNNMVPQDFTEDDLPDWGAFNMEFQQPWEGYYDSMAQPYMGDMAQRPWNRQDRRYYRPMYNNPWYGPGFNRQFMPLFWWWMLF